MEQGAFFVALAIGALFGGVVSWLVFRNDSRHAYAEARAENEGERAQLNERLAARDEQIGGLKTANQAQAGAIARLGEELRLQAERRATAEAGAAAATQATAEKLELLRQTQEEMKTAFQALASEALNSNNQAFLDLAQTTMTPVRESLGRFDEQIREVEKSRAGAYAGLTEQVAALLSEQVRLRAETGNLVKALRAPQVRGRWGEIQLRRVVEMAGMVNYCDFVEQEQVEGEDSLLRPDMIIRLPNGRAIVVDSKVSLSAYLEALETQDEDTRTQRLKEHAGQVRNHLVRLGGKKYWSRLPQTPEFVVAFLPAETFFSAALEQDPSLIEFGVDQKVILATPTTLIALLKSVAYGWQQQTLAESAEAISRLGKEIFERLCKFGDHFSRVGESLGRAVRSYNEAAGSLEARVLVSARKFQELGGPTSAELKPVEPVEATPRELQSAELGVLAAVTAGGE